MNLILTIKNLMPNWHKVMERKEKVMNMKFRIITAKDTESGGIADQMQTIKDNRVSLYHQIKSNLKKDNSPGLRDDVLSFLADYIEEVPGDDTFLYHIGQFTSNIKLTPKWYEWLLEYYAGDPKIKIQDFYMIVNAASEKDIALEDLKDIFRRNDDDQLKIMKEVYGEEDTSEEETEESPEETQQDEMEEDPEEPVEAENAALVEKNTSDNGYVGLFDDILTAVSLSRKPDASVNEVKDQFTMMFNNHQNIVAEISASVTETFRAWEKDREEIERLRSLYSMLQHVLERQTQTINELRVENFRLSNQLEEAKKVAIRREAIDRKIAELESLAKNADQGFSFESIQDQS